MATALIIPALNPDRRLPDLVESLRRRVPAMPVLVVDDGSGPAAGKIFHELKYTCGCMICRHPESYGRGAALKTGIGYMMRCHPGCTGFVIADADGQYRADDICRAATALEQHPDHFVLGTRDFSRDRLPGGNRRIASGIFRGATGAPCPDTGTELWGIPAQFGEAALELPGDRFEYEMNLLLYAAGEHIPFLEVSVPGGCRTGNRSFHFRPFRDRLRVYGAVLRHCLGRLFHPGKNKKEGEGHSTRLHRRRA